MSEAHAHCYPCVLPLGHVSHLDIMEHIAFYRVRAPYMEPILNTIDDPHMITITGPRYCPIREGTVCLQKVRIKASWLVSRDTHVLFCCTFNLVSAARHRNVCVCAMHASIRALVTSIITSRMLIRTEKRISQQMARGQVCLCQRHPLPTETSVLVETGACGESGQLRQNETYDVETHDEVTCVPAFAQWTERQSAPQRGTTRCGDERRSWFAAVGDKLRALEEQGAVSKGTLSEQCQDREREGYSQNDVPRVARTTVAGHELVGCDGGILQGLSCEELVSLFRDTMRPRPKTNRSEQKFNMLGRSRMFSLSVVVNQRWSLLALPSLLNHDGSLCNTHMQESMTADAVRKC